MRTIREPLIFAQSQVPQVAAPSEDARAVPWPLPAHRSWWLQTAAWGAIVLLMTTMSLVNYQAFQLGVDRDDAAYVILARSLLEADRYGMVNSPGSPAPERYPFGYPLVLTLPMRLLPGNLVALKAPSLIATIVGVGLLFWGWRWFSGGASRWWGVAVSGLYALSPLVLGGTGRVMSEPVFGIGCLAALLLAEPRVAGPRGALWRVSMSLVLALALATRTIGVVLVGVVLVYLFARVGKPFWRDACLIVAQMALALGIVVAITPVRIGDLVPGEYLKDQNAAILVAARDTVVAPDQAPTASDSAGAVRGTDRVVSFADAAWRTGRFYVLLAVRPVVLGFGASDGELALAARLGLREVPTAASLSIVGLIVLGLIRSARHARGAPAATWFAAAYAAALLFWTGKDFRLLYPIVAQLQWGLLFGVEAVAFALAARVTVANGAGRVATRTLIGLVAFLLVSSVARNVGYDDSRAHVGDLSARARWLNDQGQSSDVVMTEAPEVDFLYGGHKTVSYPGPTGRGRLTEAYVRAWNVKYVLVAPAIEWQTTFTPTYSAPATEMLAELERMASEGRASLVYRSGDGVWVFDVSALKDSVAITPERESFLA